MKRFRITAFILALILTFTFVGNGVYISATGMATEEIDKNEEKTGNSPISNNYLLDYSKNSAPEINAKAAILVEATTNQVVYELNSTERLYPASTTKIMTALLAYENGNMDDIITASETAINHNTLVSGGSTAGIKAGEKLTLRELLYCLLLPSANEVACVLAEYVAGSVEEFVDMMNVRAAELGCTNTHFANPHGLTNEQHYTTAHDLYCIAYEFATHEELMEIANTTSITIGATNVSDERVLTTTNHLISTRTKTQYIYEYARGIKTGYTSAAKHTLVTTAQKNGHYFICVVLGCPLLEDLTVTSFTNSKALYEWAFDTYELRTIVKKGTAVTEASVSLSKDKDSIVLETDEDVSLLLPKSDFDANEIKIVLPETVTKLTAPVEKGQKVAKVSVYYRDNFCGDIELVTASSAELSEFLDVSEKTTKFFKSTEFIATFIIIVIAIILYIVSITVASARRKKKNIYGRKYR